MHMGSQITPLTCWFPQGSGIYKQKKITHIGQHTKGHTIGMNSKKNKKKHITSITEIAQHNSCSRLPLSFYNTSTSDISITNHTTWVYVEQKSTTVRKSYQVVQDPLFYFSHLAVYNKKRKEILFPLYNTSHWWNWHTKLAKFHTMHYSLFLLLIILEFSFLHDYNNKPLQPIMHNTISHPYNYSLVIKV